MGEFDFTYILPENFEKRVVQYLLQLANRQLAEAFQHCKYEYEDVGLAYYAGLRGDNWNKRALDFTFEGICMRCGRVSPMSSRSSFEELATLFEGSGTSGAERAYRKALDKLTTILVEEGILHAVRLKRKNITRKKKEIATAIYLYQVDYDGEWGEIYFDFVNRTTEIRKLAEWDRMISKVFSKKAICYIQTHPLLVNLKEIVISFSL